MPLLDAQRILDFCQNHLYAVLFHATLIFGLSIWAFQFTPVQASAPVTASSSSSPEKSSIAKSMSGFAPKSEITLDPPKDDLISVEELAKCDGETEGKPIYVAIKGTVFDVTNKKEMYGPGAGYHIFAGKDASRGLGKSSLTPEDAVADYSTLTPEETGVLNDWYTYFSKRYNIVGKVAQ